MKPALVFFGLFLSSVAGIVAGYSDASDLLDAANWKRVVSALPVIGGAATVTGGALGALLLAFWLCRGDRSTYNNAVLGYSYLAPFFIVLIVLPGEQAKPPWAPLNLFTMLLILCISNVLATSALRDRFWWKGNRA